VSDIFSLQPSVDLIFSDVQLGDGLSFEIFTQSDLRIPVIFITGYDEFMLDAFEHNGIDYILKPVEKEAFAQSIE
jgi:two-component SAPR family response regulator